MNLEQIKQAIAAFFPTEITWLTSSDESKYVRWQWCEHQFLLSQRSLMVEEYVNPVVVGHTPFAQLIEFHLRCALGENTKRGIKKVFMLFNDKWSHNLKMLEFAIESYKQGQIDAEEFIRRQNRFLAAFVELSKDSSPDSK